MKTATPSCKSPTKSSSKSSSNSSTGSAFRPSTTPRAMATALLLVAALAAGSLALHGPIVQWAGYHEFADGRGWAGLPNALNVLSNLPFAAIGAWGWLTLRGAAPAWCALCAALAATAVGSSIYHWQPGDFTLLVDRLPIAWACASLLCAFLGERVGTRWGDARAVAVALGLATAAVAWWGIGQSVGTGDLRPYVLVQFLPMLLIPTALLLGRFGSDRDDLAVPDRAWWLALGLYAVAKAMEAADAHVMTALGAVSGHTLKHLVAAGAAGVLVAARVNSGSRR